MATPGTARPKESDWTKPAAMAIPKGGYFKLENGRYGPIFPKTPANYGFTIIAKLKPGAGGGRARVWKGDREYYSRFAYRAGSAQAALYEVGSL